MANIEDKLGASGIDLASRSGTSSKLELETVITHLPKGNLNMGMTTSGTRESNVRGWTHKAKDGGRSKRKPQGRLTPGRMGRTDDEVLVIVESQAAKLSDMDVRNKAAASENSEIKLALLRSREDQRAMKN